MKIPLNAITPDPYAVGKPGDYSHLFNQLSLDDAIKFSFMIANDKVSEFINRLLVVHRMAYVNGLPFKEMLFIVRKEIPDYV